MDGWKKRKWSSDAFAVAALATILLAFAALGMASSGGSMDQAVPRMYDPPTDQEAELASVIARGDSRVQEQLEGRHVYLGAALRTDKSPEGFDAGQQRLFDAWFYNYNSDWVVWVVVDPLHARVVSIPTVDFPFQPPLAATEIQRAASLALSMEMVSIRFPQETPGATGMLVSGPETACPINRCVLVAFLEGGIPQMDLFVLVNLSKDYAVKAIEGDWTEVYEP